MCRSCSMPSRCGSRRSSPRIVFGATCDAADRRRDPGLFNPDRPALALILSLPLLILTLGLFYFVSTDLAVAGVAFIPGYVVQGLVPGIPRRARHHDHQLDPATTLRRRQVGSFALRLTRRSQRTTERRETESNERATPACLSASSPFPSASSALKEERRRGWRWPRDFGRSPRCRQVVGELLSLREHRAHGLAHTLGGVVLPEVVEHQGPRRG